MAVVAGRQHEDWQGLRLLAQQPAQLQAIDARQHQVKDDQVRPLPTVLVQYMIAPGDHLDMEVVALQVAGDQLGQGAVVLDQENVRHRCLGVWVEVSLWRALRG
ncbi:hypothetical protein D9M71_769270 [compost metagenome]